MNNTTFSIIVPVYNVEKYINECVESVLSQDYESFELILVDDGSTDDSGIICDMYSQRDYRVKVIHKENNGLVSARKTGIGIATGQYTLIIDGDDYIRKDSLTMFDNILKSNDVDVICYNICLLYDDKTIENGPFEKNELYSKDMIRERIFPYLIENKNGKYFSNSICGKVFKTSLYKRYQICVDNRIAIGEDAACTKPLIFNCNSLYVLKDYLYYYRQNDLSMTKSKKPFSLVTPRLIGEHLEKEMDMSFGDNQEQVYRLVVHYLFNACYSQFYRNDKKQVIKFDILKTLDNYYYSNAIKKCKYSLKNIKGNIALMSLKLRLYILMLLYCKIK